MQEGFRSLGYDIGESESPVVPILTEDDTTALVLWRRLLDEGIFTNPVPGASAAVPPGGARLRTSYMATHTDDHLDFVLDKFAKLGKELGII